MTLEHRVEKLEQRTGAGKQVVICVRYEGDDTAPTEAQREAAIADYKAKNPDRKEGDFIVLYWQGDHFGFSPRNEREALESNPVPSGGKPRWEV